MGEREPALVKTGEANGNVCLGNREAVQDRVGKFLAVLTGRKDEVRRCCGTVLQSGAGTLLRDSRPDSWRLANAHPTLALVYVRSSGGLWQFIEEQGARSAETIPCDGWDLATVDSDVRADALHRHSEWRGLSGQVGAAQRHLENQGVGVGDVFLFFGLFRRIERTQRGWRFVRNAPRQHILWGWLQIEQVCKVDEISSGSILNPSL